MTDGPPAEPHIVEFALTEDDLVAFANVGWGRSVLLQFDVGTLRLFAFLAVVAIVPLLGLVGGAEDWWEDPTFRHRAVGVVAVALVGRLRAAVAQLFLTAPHSSGTICGVDGKAASRADIGRGSSHDAHLRDHKRL